ncbi:helix-turn-helix domain-containing protein [Chitinophaga pinensis]|uniref:Transcriptional regulator, AraC family n=1 Tax=Chitinophaga pinensis (strain ATCC 43595 / DSM 2588 / LMG 13176 / NBRC 15968 / NCIMB 11800 / UQM 2034) TaxID=485918 RepID=A0A979G403_CHIPD|nr:AraC family transcriptional regulator [Chitinophaga pinensis]ACU60377.1 transcriptional regulator, AraC family [Chitinophaga pinensis DSM 2588]
MVTDYKKMDLFGETFIQKVILQPPFEFPFPVRDSACFLFSMEGDLQFHQEEEQYEVSNNYSLLLTCVNSGKKVSNSAKSTKNEVVVISFHPGTLKKIYERDRPLLLQKPKNNISNQCSEKVNNDFLIKKYIEGLLFYFENPSLVNEDILIIKLKEIILLLSQTQNADTIQVILSQLFSPATYTFKQIIEANIFLQVGVEDLAQKTNLSVSSFKREFAKHYNDSPANYIKTKRLEKAAELLIASDERVTDIAFDCGFNDLANFTKSFHDKYNITPTNYRLKSK